MTGQRVGYIRVSSDDQNPVRQLEGIVLDRIFTDRASAKDIQALLQKFVFLKNWF